MEPRIFRWLPATACRQSHPNSVPAGAVRKQASVAESYPWTRREAESLKLDDFCYRRINAITHPATNTPPTNRAKQ